MRLDHPQAVGVLFGMGCIHYRPGTVGVLFGMGHIHYRPGTVGVLFRMVNSREDFGDASPSASRPSVGPCQLSHLQVSWHLYSDSQKIRVSDANHVAG